MQCVAHGLITHTTFVAMSRVDRWDVHERDIGSRSLGKTKDILVFGSS